MTVNDLAIVRALDAILKSDEVRSRLGPIVERVRQDLAARHRALMAWEPIPLSIYGKTLPPQLKSSWVFILRAGVNTGAERHPNSHQRMMSFEGSGDMQVGGVAADTAAAAGKTSNAGVRPRSAEPSEKWRSNVLVSNPHAPLEQRWISIPQNVWHQPVVPKEADWVVVSFHTVPAEELIEERPVEDAVSGTRQKRYLG
jgi:hypothetical protein